jgi:hypothetical protein
MTDDILKRWVALRYAKPFPEHLMWLQGRHFLDKGRMSLPRGAHEQTIPWLVPVGDDQAKQAVNVRRVAAENSFSEVSLVTLERLENPEQ